MPIELRWFHPELLPDRIEKWFGEAKWEKRIDYYLYIPNENMGIKLREKKLEIKYRINNYSFTSANTSKKVEGIAENWIKWEWKDEQVEDLQTQSAKEDVIEQNKLWIKVKKERAQRKYKITQDESKPLEISIDTNADCAVEITRLSVLDKNWWTLGFDYFLNQDDTRNHNLNVMIGWIFKDYPDDNLYINNSYGYPKWLSTLNMF